MIPLDFPITIFNHQGNTSKNLVIWFRTSAVRDLSLLSDRSLGQEIFGKFHIASLSEINRKTRSSIRQPRFPVACGYARSGNGVQSESEAERLGKCLGSNASTFHSYCIPIAYLYVYGWCLSYPPICGIWERPSHTPESSPEPRFPAQDLGWEYGAPEEPKRGVRGSWITSDVGGAIVCISRIPTHTHAHTYKTHALAPTLWDYYDAQSAITVCSGYFITLRVCTHIYSTHIPYTHGCGGVTSKSVNIAASWLPVWPTQRRAREKNKDGVATTSTYPQPDK